jgi:hypothetical protein
MNDESTTQPNFLARNRSTSIRRGRPRRDTPHLTNVCEEGWEVKEGSEEGKLPDQITLMVCFFVLELLGFFIVVCLLACFVSICFS